MKNYSPSGSVTIDEIIGDGIRKEEELLAFYQEVLPSVEYDTLHLFETLIIGSQKRISALTEAKQDLAMIRSLTGPMAD